MLINKRDFNKFLANRKLTRHTRADNTILIRYRVTTNLKTGEIFVFLKLILELVHIKFQAKFLYKFYASVFFRETPKSMYTYI